MVTVYETVRKRRFSAPLVSVSCAAHVLLLAMLWIAPFLAVVSTPNLWPREASYQEQPEIRFKRQVVVHFSLSDGGSFSWSTSRRLAVLSSSQSSLSGAVPAVSGSEQDDDHDGMPDVVTARVQLPLPSSGAVRVTSARVLLLYQCSMTARARVGMEGHAWLDFASVPQTASGVRVFAHGSIRQGAPFPVTHVRDDYNSSVLPSEDAVVTSAPSLEEIMLGVASRNDTLRLSPRYDVWDHRPTPSGSRRAFSIELSLQIKRQQVRYRPGYAEVLKFSWIQYLCLWWPFLALYRLLKWLLFSQRLLPSWEIPKTTPSRPSKLKRL